MYIFAKFVTDHIFLQIRDKINIKKNLEVVEQESGPSKIGRHSFGPAVYKTNAFQAVSPLSLCLYVHRPIDNFWPNIEWHKGIYIYIFFDFSK
jgi:hypothetical protein